MKKVKMLTLAFIVLVSYVGVIYIAANSVFVKFMLQKSAAVDLFNEDNKISKINIDLENISNDVNFI